MTTPITLTIGARNLTAHYDDLSFSNVDPGGYEQLTATVTDSSGVKAGDEVTVRCGLETAWQGRLNEIGDRDAGAATVQLAALGFGAKLTDRRITEIFVDATLEAWGDIPMARKVAHANDGLSIGNYTWAPEDNGIVLAYPDRAAVNLSVAEVAYRPVPGVQVSSVFYQGQNYSLPAGFILRFTAADTDAGTSETYTPTFDGNFQQTNLSTARTYLRLYVYGSGTTPAAGAMTRFWNIGVYGTHGITQRAVAGRPNGFHTADIVRWVNAQAATGFEVVADDSSSFIIPHAVYREPVAHEQIIADMAKLMGWHYGTWEPAGVLGSAPRLFFTAPPAAVTCVVARRDIAGLDAPKVRVDKLYDTAKVKWTDAAGSAGITTVTLSNPLAQAAGVSGRVLDLDMGLGDATTATTFGGFALALALAGARGGGSGTLPATVRLPGGGAKPACLLKAGRDRARILDLSDSGALTAADADRQDSFLVRRVETTVQDGTPATRVEFDGGADLLEVLQARLSLAATTAG